MNKQAITQALRAGAYIIRLTSKHPPSLHAKDGTIIHTHLSQLFVNKLIGRGKIAEGDPDGRLYWKGKAR